LRYFTEFGKHSFQHITAASSCGGIYAGVFVFCITCTMSSWRKFTFAISSPDEFLVSYSVSLCRVTTAFACTVTGCGDYEAPPGAV